MNISLKKAIIFGLFTAFLVLGAVSMKRAMPDAKEERIYQAIKVYSPYIVQKKVGGLEILDKRSGIKEKPSSQEIFHRLDELDKKWGKEHLRVENNEVIVIGENNQTVTRLYIENEKERSFLTSFFGI
ncbi:MAG: hypothetical protein QG559_690 [Campylobacterota bacterium]|nr:hypothetical protein [Campylobacterota bacterium]